MKKWVASITIFLLLISFTACSADNTMKTNENGSSKKGSSEKISGVPDKYLKMDIEDYIYKEEITENYAFTATHDYDENSLVDSVAITLDFMHEFGKESLLAPVTINTINRPITGLESAMFVGAI